MGQIYTDPERENEPTALPNAEVFHVPTDYDPETETENGGLDPGWYWWSCFHGCLPDGDPVGPFGTEAEAMADAQEQD